MSKSDSYSPALQTLKSCKNRDHVKNAMDLYGKDVCNDAWKQLTNLEKASLLLAREFDGTIIDGN